MHDYTISFGARLKIARNLRGWSQQDLGLLANVPRNNLSRIETGAKTLSWETACRIATALDLPLDWFAEPVEQAKAIV